MIFTSIRQVRIFLNRGFDCGIEELNAFLKNYAYKNDLNGIGRTYVAFENDVIYGFITLCTASINFKEAPEIVTGSLPKYPIPCIKIARLAVNKNNQGQHIGSFLLQNAFMKILQASEIAGIYLVLVDAKENAIGFYEHYGFKPLKDATMTYYLPVKTIELASK